MPASENLIEQSNQFNETINRYGDDIAVIHVLSGLEPMSSDIAQMRQQLNTSWPIYWTRMNSLPRHYLMEYLIRW